MRGKVNLLSFVHFKILDHPRTCGEKFKPFRYMYFGIGSPPHMRGKVCCLIHLFNNIRITPAHAGKRVQVKFSTTQGRDHPRTCGEKLVKLSLYIKLTGSPPHMRGKVKAYNKQTGATRITPAHAGKRM